MRLQEIVERVNHDFDAFAEIIEDNLCDHCVEETEITKAGILIPGEECRVRVFNLVRVFASVPVPLPRPTGEWNEICWN